MRERLKMCMPCPARTAWVFAELKEYYLKRGNIFAAFSAPLSFSNTALGYISSGKPDFNRGKTKRR